MFTRSKYGNQRHRGYASRREAELGVNLHALANAGEITILEEQVRYTLVPSQQGKIRDERPVTYVADFQYRDKQDVLHVVDAKGFRTKDYIMKRKLMKWLFDIEIEEL